MDREAPDGSWLAVLNLFLDLERDPQERDDALNDRRVPDRDVAAFVSSLSGELRLAALAGCNRAGLLDVWAAEGGPEDRARIAFNPCTSSATLKWLATDQNPRVRAQLPFNPNTPVDVLAGLVLDPASLVQQALGIAFDTDLGLALRQGQRGAEFDPGSSQSESE